MLSIGYISNALSTLELIPSPRSNRDDEDDFEFVDYDEYDAQVFKLPVPSFG